MNYYRSVCLGFMGKSKGSGENQRGRESFLELQEEIEQVDGNAGGQTSCVVERNKGIGNLLLTAAEGGGKGDRLLYLCQDNRHG